MTQHQNIVIVTGAGASTELGIPCGKSLLNEFIGRLCTALNYDESGSLPKITNGIKEGKYRIDMINQLLKNFSKLSSENDYYITNDKEGEFIAAINSFREDLEKFITRHSGNTIDYFLQMNESKKFYKDIGRFVIAYHFIGYENNLMQENFYCLKKNWLRNFLESHIVKIMKYKFNLTNLKIITFNYDRTIEHFTYTFLRNKVGLTDEDAKRVIQKFDITHIYGKIGELGWQTSDSTKIIRFGERNDNQTFLNWAKDNIGLIGYRIPNKEELQNKINAYIESSTRIYFLGFGYDEENLSFFNKIPRNTSVVGTVYGLGDKKNKIKELKKKWKKFIYKNMECFELIQSLEKF